MLSTVQGGRGGTPSSSIGEPLTQEGEENSGAKTPLTAVPQDISIGSTATGLAGQSSVQRGVKPQNLPTRESILQKLNDDPALSKKISQDLQRFIVILEKSGDEHSQSKRQLCAHLAEQSKGGQFRELLATTPLALRLVAALFTMLKDNHFNDLSKQHVWVILANLFTNSFLREDFAKDPLCVPFFKHFLLTLQETNTKKISLATKERACGLLMNAFNNHQIAFQISTAPYALKFVAALAEIIIQEKSKPELSPMAACAAFGLIRLGHNGAFLEQIFNNSGVNREVILALLIALKQAPEAILLVECKRMALTFVHQLMQYPLVMKKLLDLTFAEELLRGVLIFWHGEKLDPLALASKNIAGGILKDLLRCPEFCQYLPKLQAAKELLERSLTSLYASAPAKVPLLWKHLTLEVLLALGAQDRGAQATIVEAATPLTVGVLLDLEAGLAFPQRSKLLSQFLGTLLMFVQDPEFVNNIGKTQVELLVTFIERFLRGEILKNADDLVQSAACESLIYLYIHNVKFREQTLEAGYPGRFLKIYFSLFAAGSTSKVISKTVQHAGKGLSKLLAEPSCCSQIFAESAVFKELLDIQGTAFCRTLLVILEEEEQKANLPVFKTEMLTLLGNLTLNEIFLQYLQEAEFAGALTKVLLKLLNDEDLERTPLKVKAGALQVLDNLLSSVALRSYLVASLGSWPLLEVLIPLSQGKYTEEIQLEAKTILNSLYQEGDFKEQIEKRMQLVHDLEAMLLVFSLGAKTAIAAAELDKTAAEFLRISLEPNFAEYTLVAYGEELLRELSSIFSKTYLTSLSLEAKEKLALGLLNLCYVPVLKKALLAKDSVGLLVKTLFGLFNPAEQASLTPLTKQTLGHVLLELCLKDLAAARVFLLTDEALTLELVKLFLVGEESFLGSAEFQGVSYQSFLVLIEQEYVKEATIFTQLGWMSEVWLQRLNTLANLEISAKLEHAELIYRDTCRVLNKLLDSPLLPGVGAVGGYRLVEVLLMLLGAKRAQPLAVTTIGEICLTLSYLLKQETYLPELQARADEVVGLCPIFASILRLDGGDPELDMAKQRVMTLLLNLISDPGLLLKMYEGFATLKVVPLFLDILTRGVPEEREQPQEETIKQLLCLFLGRVAIRVPALAQLKNSAGRSLSLIFLDLLQRLPADDNLTEKIILVALASWSSLPEFREQLPLAELTTVLQSLTAFLEKIACEKIESNSASIDISLERQTALGEIFVNFSAHPDFTKAFSVTGGLFAVVHVLLKISSQPDLDALKQRLGKVLVRLLNDQAGLGELDVPTVDTLVKALLVLFKETLLLKVSAETTKQACCLLASCARAQVLRDKVLSLYFGQFTQTFMAILNPANQREIIGLTKQDIGALLNDLMTYPDFKRYLRAGEVFNPTIRSFTNILRAPLQVAEPPPEMALSFLVVLLAEEEATKRLTREQVLALGQALLQLLEQALQHDEVVSQGLQLLTFLAHTPDFASCLRTQALHITKLSALLLRILGAAPWSPITLATKEAASKLYLMLLAEPALKNILCKIAPLTLQAQLGPSRSLDELTRVWLQEILTKLQE